MTSKSTTNTLINDLKTLLLQGITATQENICTELEAKGHVINQSKISRLLRRINAVKSKNEQGEMIYRLPLDVMPPSIDTALSELIIDIVNNETTIIIKTSPGSASLIARILDNKKCQIIGTIAGDDTIFAAPESVKKIDEACRLLRVFMGVDG